MTGMNLYFMRNRLPLSAEWRFFNRDIWERIAKMLVEDIPVIMAVGPNFPFFWHNNRTVLYTKDSAGNYHQSSSTKAHYVTVTGLDESWAQISSWGGFCILTAPSLMNTPRSTAQVSCAAFCT